MRAGTFVTLFLAILDPATRQLTWSSAGHPGFHLDADGNYKEVRATNLVLSLLDDVRYESATLQLEPGDMLVLPTDGIYEATSVDKELFGRDRMLQCVRDARQSTSEEIITVLAEACRRFAGDNPIHDDVTCVLIKVE